MNVLDVDVLQEESVLDFAPRATTPKSWSVSLNMAFAQSLPKSFVAAALPDAGLAGGVALGLAPGFVTPCRAFSSAAGLTAGGLLAGDEDGRSWDDEEGVGIATFSGLTVIPARNPGKEGDTTTQSSAVTPSSTTRSPSSSCPTFT